MGFRAGMIQVEEGARPLHPLSVTHGAQAILGGGTTLGKACVGRGHPLPHPPREHVPSAWNCPSLLLPTELQLTFQVYVSFPLALKSVRDIAKGRTGDDYLYI